MGTLDNTANAPGTAPTEDVNRLPSEFTERPDLRTLEGQLRFLEYHPPDQDRTVRHMQVENATQVYWHRIADAIPDGPGKTRALHALSRAKMEMNCAIANHGA